jgi:hypothetical protein
VSSLVPARHRDAPDSATAARSAARSGVRLNSDRFVAVVLGVALCFVVFVATGGVDLTANTWTEIALLAVGAVAAATVILVGRPAPRWGGVSLMLFVALAVLTALSIAWSVVPDVSWLEANRTLAYLAVFATGLALARLLPERWAAVVGGVAIAATVVSGWALLVKVFPGTLDAGDVFGRLRAPFGYWNATGLMAALGLPACVWIGARREGGRITRALSPPAIAVLVTVIMLSYSRSALVAAVIGVGVWFCIVPLRLRGAAVAGAGLAGGAVLSAWALASDGLSGDRQSLAARTSAGHKFGLLLVVVLALLAVAGWLLVAAEGRVSLAPRRRHRIGVVLVCLVALVPAGAIVGAAASSRGLTGEASHIWSTLTNANGGVTNTPSRLVQFGNSRPRYWGEGLHVGEHALLAGVGAAGYGVARTKYTTDPQIVAHAHSYLIETFADFGVVGLLVSLGLLISWALAARRTLRVPAGGLSDLQVAERGGALTLLSVVVVFGLHSAVDWTWFVPGTVVPALVCAGWLAGRGPLEEPVGRVAEPRSLLARPRAAAALASLLVVAVASGWLIWQPLRSADADAASITALSGGNAGTALADARTAAASNPLSPEPLYQLSAIYSALDRQSEAHAELLKAVGLQPKNPATWRQLGFYELAHHNDSAAVAALGHSLKLDRTSLATIIAFNQAAYAHPARGKSGG